MRTHAAATKAVELDARAQSRVPTCRRLVAKIQSNRGSARATNKTSRSDGSMKKRQSNKSDVNANPVRSDDSSLVAWESNPQAQALRVDLQNGVLFVFPYSQFAFAHFERKEDSDTLRISFTTHDVRVSGRNLRELGIALQKLAVA